MIPRAAPPEHFPWIEARTGCALTPKATAIEVVDDKGEIAGMVAYDGWTVNAVQCHWALRHPAALRSLLPAIFRYPFLQAKRRIMLGAIPADNARSLHLAQRLGLRERHRVVDGWSDGIDLILLGLDRRDCAWLAPEERA